MLKNVRIYKGVSANVDFYSGFVYSMLGSAARIVYTDVCQWQELSAGVLIEWKNLINADKIIRPAYKNVLEPAVYVPLNER